MYKSKLQELCQRQSWELPEYTAVKDGPNHMPRFTATVSVQGQLFEIPAPCKSSKEAQNTAAQIAFNHLTSPPPAAAPSPPPAAAPSPPFIASTDARLPGAPPQIPPVAIGANPPPLPLSPFPSSLPDPPVGLLTMKKYNVSAKPLKEELPQENCYDTSESPVDYKSAIGSQNKDILHMYKNLLQQYAQKENLGFPVYTSEAEGPPHDRRFKSKVSINEKSYSTLEFFSTLKEAEQAAAKIACQTLSVDTNQEDKGLYKNLLQEFALKKGMMCPSYETASSGSSHKPIFVSTVEIGTNSFKGAESKTKKQAEMNAAKVAYYALMQGCPPTNSVMSSPTNRSTFAGNLSQTIRPIAPTEKHQAATDAGCPPTNSVMSSPTIRSTFAGNLSQTIQPTAPTEKHQAGILSQTIQPSAPTEKHQAAKDAEGHQDTKRAKSVLKKADVSPIKPPSNDTTMESSTITEPHHEPTVENNKPSIQWKTVVFPRKFNRPIPENASVMPYSDNQWVAYRAKLDQKPTA